MSNCPNCKNIMRENSDYPSILECHNDKCEIGNILVTPKLTNQPKSMPFYKKLLRPKFLLVAPEFLPRKVKPEDKIVATFDTPEQAKKYWMDKLKEIKKKQNALEKADKKGTIDRTTKEKKPHFIKLDKFGFKI